MSELEQIEKTEKILAHPEDLGTETEVYARISGYMSFTRN